MDGDRGGGGWMDGEFIMMAIDLVNGDYSIRWKWVAVYDYDSFIVVMKDNSLLLSNSTKMNNKTRTEFN